MKLSNPLSLILMAAASSDVSGTGSKSGKGGGRLANGGDYKWVLGRYTECEYTGFRLKDGELREILGEECDDGEELVIERLGNDQNGLTFQATYNKPARGPAAPRRYIYEGVASYNPKYIDQITFYTDHREKLVNGNWEPYPDSQESDVSTIRVSQLDGYGSSVVADVYRNGQVPARTSSAWQGEWIVTYLFTDVDSESE